MSTPVIYLGTPPNSTNSYTGCSADNQWWMGFDISSLTPRNGFYISSCSNLVATSFSQNYGEWNHWAISYNNISQSLSYYKVFTI